MPSNEGYSTKSRMMILEYLKQNISTTVSAASILEHLNSNGLDINKSTVYRYLKKLCTDNLIIKYVDRESEVTVYQYIGENHHCSEHLHLQCKRCEKIIHLDCGFMEELKGHLAADHKFELQCEGNMLQGICSKCSET